MKCKGMLLIISTIAVAAAAPTPEPASGKLAPIATQVSAQETGPFLVRARPVLIRGLQAQNRTCLLATFRVSIENNSPADVGVAIVGASLSGADDLGFDLIPHRANYWDGNDGRTGGIPTIYGVGSDWQKTVNDNKSAFLFLSPRQSTTAIITPFGNGGSNCVDDKDGAYLKNHVVSAASLAGAFAVFYPDGKSEQRGFAFDDLPARVTQ